MKLSFFILSILLILVALMHANLADASQVVTVGQSAIHVKIASLQPCGCQNNRHQLDCSASPYAHRP
jgi:hypothetical protein